MKDWIYERLAKIYEFYDRIRMLFLHICVSSSFFFFSFLVKESGCFVFKTKTQIHTFGSKNGGPNSPQCTFLGFESKFPLELVGSKLKFGFSTLSHLFLLGPQFECWLENKLEYETKCSGQLICFAIHRDSSKIR